MRFFQIPYQKKGKSRNVGVRRLRKAEFITIVEFMRLVSGI